MIRRLFTRLIVNACKEHVQTSSVQAEIYHRRDHNPLSRPGFPGANQKSREQVPVKLNRGFVLTISLDDFLIFSYQI